MPGASIAVLALAVLLQFQPSQTLPPPAAETHFLRGQHLEKSGDLQGASDSFQKAIAAHPDYADAFRARGKVLEKLSDLDGAKHHYLEATRLAPETAANHFSLGLACEQLEDLGQAVSSYRRAIQLDPKMSAAHYSLGIVLERAGELESAIPSYREAVRLNPSHLASTLNLGEALQRQGESAQDPKSFQEAEEVFRAALSLATTAKPHLRLANLLQQQQRFEEAAHHFRSGLAITPNNAPAQFSLGLVEEARGNWSGAKAEYLKAVRLAPGHLPVRRYFAKFLRKHADFTEAAEGLQSLLEIDPTDKVLHMELAEMMAQDGNLLQAENGYRNALALDPGLESAHTKLGIVQRQLGKLADARGSLETALALNPADAGICTQLGVVHKLSGDLASAAASYQQAIDLNPEHAAAYGNLGIVQMLQQSWEEAESSFWAALKLDPDYDGAYYSLSGVLSLRGKVEEAKALVARRVELATAKGIWPFRLSMTQLDSNKLLQSRLRHEEEFASRYVAAALDLNSEADESVIRRLASAVTENPPEGLHQLIPVLRGVRNLENSTEWALRRWNECLELGSGSVACAYGTTWFETWLSIMADSTLSRAIPGYIASGLQYTVGGSAIGYQCLFAATALGFNCTGYELLQCLVADSKSLAGDLSRAVESVDVGFVCGDATNADLSTTGVLWLNDALWPPEVRVNMLLRAVSAMPPGSTVISYQAKPDDRQQLSKLQNERVMRAAVSWNPAQEFFLWTVAS
ncbi:Ogt [Symbiodinium sp. CCMP2456]|nr:Ogt [Symbiodinium sp. CCMP2456]